MKILGLPPILRMARRPSRLRSIPSNQTPSREQSPQIMEEARSLWRWNRLKDLR